MELATILTVVNSAASLAVEATKLVNGVQGVLSTSDRAEVQAALAVLESRNDDLTAAVRASLAQAAQE